MANHRSALALVLLAVTLAGPTYGAILCRKNSGAVFVRDACKKKEQPVAPSSLGLQVTVQGSCQQGQAVQGLGVDGTVTCGPTVPEESVTSGQIQNVTRTIVVPARALAYNATSGILTPATEGLRYPLDNTVSSVTLPRPADWDGASDVTIRIFFSQETAAAGDVQFFVRPRIYDSGDPFLDADAHLTNRTPMTASSSRHEVLVGIPAAAFGGKAWWQLVVQRNDEGDELYPDGVVVTSIAIEYTAVR